MSLTSSLNSTIPSPPAHPLISPSSQPNLRLAAATQPSPPFERSATTPAKLGVQPALKRRSTVIGGESSSAVTDYRKSIIAIREADKREQARAMSAILRPQKHPPRPRPRIVDHVDSRGPVSPERPMVERPSPSPAPQPSPTAIVSPVHSPPVHRQEHGPLATEHRLQNAFQVISTVSLGITGDLNPHPADASPTTDAPSSSPVPTPTHKPRRSLHVGKLSRLLTKLRKDDPRPPSRQDSPQPLAIPPVPPIPSTLSVTCVSPTRSRPAVLSPAASDQHSSASPRSISHEPHPLPPASPVIKKKQSFSQRIARRLSLSHRRADPADRSFNATEALPLPPVDSAAYLAQSAPRPSDHSSQQLDRATLSPPLPLAKPAALTDHTHSHSSKTDSGSDARSNSVSLFARSLDQSPFSSRLSGSTSDCVPGFELPVLPKDAISVDPSRTSQVYLTPSTSDKDLTRTPEGSQLRSYPHASPSPGLSYSTDQAYSAKGYFPTCLPSPALSDFHSPSSPIDPSFIPAPSPPTRRALAPLEVCKSNLYPSLTNLKIISSSTGLTASSADLSVQPISTGSYGGFVSVSGLSPTNLYSSNVSTDSLGIPHAPRSSCTDNSFNRVCGPESPREDLPPSHWWASSESEMAQSVFTRTSFGGTSLNSNIQPPRSSLSTQIGGGRSRPTEISSSNNVGSQANQSAHLHTGFFVRGSDKRGGNKQRGSGSDSEHSSHENPSRAMGLIEDTEEGESDDSDDVPLGQRHPDALKVQKSLREDRAKRHARRKAREAAKAEADAKALALAQRQIKAAEEENRKAIVAQQAQVQRELDLAATAAKLSMASEEDANSEDDNKPLGLLKRQKSSSRSKPPLRDPFAISPDELSRRLERVQQQARTKPEQQQRPTGLSIKTDMQIPEPIGHPLLPQTDASVNSRKASCGQLEPLSPFIQESVLTWGNSIDVAVDDDEQELAPILKSSSSNHNSGALPRSRQELYREDHSQPRRPVATGLGLHRSPNLNMVDLKPATTSAHPRREGLKRGQTMDVPTQSHRSKLDSSHPHASVSDQRSRTDGLRRGNTTAARQRGTSPTNSPPIPSNAFLPPIPGPSSTLLGRAKSTSRRPSALAIPSQPLPSSDHGALSPTLSPTMGCSMSRTASRRALQRVSIVDQKHTMMIEIDEKTLVADLLREVEQRGELNRHPSKGFGEWGVFEVWHDLGIERPIREIETIFSVVDTWTANTDNSYLLVQRHALASLAIQNRAITAGSWGTNLVCELKPGKWSKKFVVLKENAIYICANEKGKDEIFLCTLTNFDVFYVNSSIVKAPRPFAFGVKSLDKFSFFETKSDFVHYFACKDENTQLEWIRRIYDARTFYIMSNATAIQESNNRSKTSDPPSTTLIRTSGDHVRSKPMSNTNSAHSHRTVQSAGPPMIPEASSRHSKTNESVPTARLPSANGLTRRPTLLGLEQSSKFRHGTLLGDLNSGAPPPPPASSIRPIQAALPSHVTPVVGSTNSNPTVRGWEQMGPVERKEHLAEVQARAKMDGKTLLRFEEKDPFGGALKKVTTSGSGGESAAAPADSKALSRSRTLGSRKT